MQHPEYLVNDLDDDALCELAMENEDGPLAAIQGLIEGALLRGGLDDATTAALTAILVQHLPDLVELHEEASAAAKR